jgi:RNA polymerase sigma-70 factor (ECF subfamily)
VNAAPGPKPGVSPLSTRFETEAFPHTDALMRTALRMTRNRSDAEDLVSETMLKAFRAFDRFEPGSNIRAWLFKIMTNLFINRYRKQVRAPKETSIDDLQEFVLFREMTDHGKYDPERPDSKVFSDLFASTVQAEIDQLPDEFRDVAVLAILEDFSYQDIAQMLGLELGTVKSRLFRGRKLLQSRLADSAREMGLLKSSPKP